MLGDEDALGWSGLSTIVFLDNDRDHKKAFSHGISFFFKDELSFVGMGLPWWFRQ